MSNVDCRIYSWFSIVDQAAEGSGPKYDIIEGIEATSSYEEPARANLCCNVAEGLK